MADKESIKNIINEQLNNVYVTDELKSKTLKKCRMSNYSKKKNMFNKRFNIAIAAGLVFIMFLGSYFINLVKSREDKYSQQPNSNNENTSIAKLDSQNGDSKDCIEKNSQNYEDNKKNKDEITQNKIKDDKNKTNNKTKIEKRPIINEKKDVKIAKKENVRDVTQKQRKEDIKQNNASNNEEYKRENELDLKIKNVEKSWGGKIDFPEYVPKGYEMYDLVACNDKNKKAIKIIYKNDDNYFEIKQMKEPVNGTILAVIEEKSHQSNDKNNDKDKTPDIDTVKNGIYYNVKGSVSKEILEKVMDSIN